MRRALLSILLVLAGCESSTPLPDDVAAISLSGWGPSTLVSGSTLVVRGQGFRSNEEMSVRLFGQVQPPGGGPLRRLDVEMKPQLADLGVLHLRIGSELFDAAGGEGQLEGRLTVSTVREGKRHEASLDVEIRLAHSLEPRLLGPSEEAVFFGDELKLEGSDFLLGGGEGELEILVSGAFLPDDGGPEQLLEKRKLPVRVDDRDAAVYVHTSELFDLKTGEFSGRFTPWNIPSFAEPREGAGLDVTLQVLPSAIAAFSPAAASRGEKVTVAGNGLWSSQSEGVVTELRLSGTFRTRDGGQENISESVEISTSQSAIWSLVPRNVDGELRGFGRVPGVFTGRITPVLVGETKELEGLAWEGSFTVKPTLQVVHLKFTPQFPDSLRLYGLRNLDAQVRARIFETVRRDYADYSLRFVESEPQDFAEWTTIELTGDDPNEAFLFGLDNTEGKDFGNLRLDDYVGGASAAEYGSYAYGGVFMASFMLFSPNICREQQAGTSSIVFRRCSADTSEFPLATSLFDEVFSPFAPLLGGQEATFAEYESGARKEAVRRAVKALGSMAGNTVSHELGHSLGLAQDTGLDEFHNSGEESGLLMNPGSERSFVERAELDGTPAVWSPGDAAYLQEILPR